MLDIIRKMPNRQFLIVGGWEYELNTEETSFIESSLKKQSNVERIGNLNDLRPIFAQSYCLLMPSVAQEAYGRIAAEVQISSLPVIASSQGALIETVGKGGVIIDYSAPTEKWVGTLNSLFDDKVLYSKLSRYAKAESIKRENNTNYIKQQWRDLSATLTGTLV